MNNYYFDDFIMYRVTKNEKKIFRIKGRLGSYIKASCVKRDTEFEFKDMKEFLTLDETYTCSFENRYLWE